MLFEPRTPARRPTSGEMDQPRRKPTSGCSAIAGKGALTRAAPTLWRRPLEYAGSEVERRAEALCLTQS
jgi:hypothetical protein